MPEVKPDDKILSTIKTLVDVPQDYDVFDNKLLLYINSVFMTLDDLGVGPEGGFFVSSDEVKWSNFLNTVDYEYFSAVSTYVGLKVRMLFDPPQTGPLLDSMQKMIEQYEWRLNVRREHKNYVPPEG